MTAVRVVLSNGEDDELELGPFNQGVVLDGWHVRDVASTDVVAYIGILRYQGDEKAVWRVTHDGQATLYRDLFVHAVSRWSLMSTTELLVIRSAFGAGHPIQAEVEEELVRRPECRFIDELPVTLRSGETFITSAPEDGACRIEGIIPYRYSAAAREWLADGETREDETGNGAVKIGQEHRGDRGTYVTVCDILGGHVRSVELATWESWLLN